MVLTTLDPCFGVRRTLLEVEEKAPIALFIFCIQCNHEHFRFVCRAKVMRNTHLGVLTNTWLIAETSKQSNETNNDARRRGMNASKYGTTVSACLRTHSQVPAPR